MSQVKNSRVFKYHIAIVAAAGGFGLMLLAALGQTVTFCFSQISALSLAIPFLTGAGITLFVSVLLQRRLDSLREDLRDEFDQRTRELKNVEERFREYAETSSDWFWETDAENRFVFFSSRIFKAMGISSDDVIGKRREDPSYSF